MYWQNSTTVVDVMMHLCEECENQLDASVHVKSMPCALHEGPPCAFRQRKAARGEVLSGRRADADGRTDTHAGLYASRTIPPSVWALAACCVYVKKAHGWQDKKPRRK